MNESDLFGESQKIKRNKAKLIPEQITLLSELFSVNQTDTSQPVLSNSQMNDSCQSFILSESNRCSQCNQCSPMSEWLFKATLLFCESDAFSSSLISEPMALLSLFS